MKIYSCLQRLCWSVEMGQQMAWWQKKTKIQWFKYCALDLCLHPLQFTPKRTQHANDLFCIFDYLSISILKGVESFENYSSHLINLLSESSIYVSVWLLIIWINWSINLEFIFLFNIIPSKYYFCYKFNLFKQFCFKNVHYY